MPMTVQFRYRSGAEDQWDVHDGSTADLPKLAREGLQAGAGVIMFGTISDAGESASSYGRALVRMSDVVSVHIDDITDERAAAALSAELSGAEPDETR